MNKNIEVINENLLAVNFDYVKMGYIKGLNFSHTATDDDITIIGDGKIIVNTANKDSNRFIEIMTAMMLIPDDLIGTKKGFYCYIRKRIPKWEHKDDKWVDTAIKYYNLEFHERGYNAFCKWEITRRKVKAEYIINNKKPNVIDRIKKIFIRKEVK